MADPYPFKNKVIAVTGASRGTGLSLTRYLLVRGATVSMAATSEANLAKALEGIRSDIPDVEHRVMTYSVDIGNAEQVKAWIEATVAKFGPLDGAANVAAQMMPRIWPIEILPHEDVSQCLHVNVVGTFNCLQNELKHMKRGGSIVNCGSILSGYSSAGVSAYCAAKHAVVGLTKAAAYEGAAKNIRVNVLSPGCIDTDLIRQPLIMPNGEGWTVTEDDNLTSIIKRWAKPEEIAASIAFLLGDECRMITRQEWRVDGGWLESDYVGGHKDYKHE
ncbi:hypothetical protein PFICI_13632 [Pestalotiopsis fici W106-1]|uniref:NAD(P)-binding protein n=1 Tax=Pestalotiopsis fici (strain W106-1 / CGMCC3.15140) TaxID=1229662 RepID=W3WMR1_PESFW|nr:uncharacterized protein PFICI_13632 [Pestalotiopsis fici W106-1]ETS75148.1 hypothetical protein PFICI_13632 [Pestalotiopsis fici W106-1]